MCCRSRPSTPSATSLSARRSWRARHASRASSLLRTGLTWSCTASCTCSATITRTTATRRGWKRAKRRSWHNSGCRILMAEEHGSTGRWLRRITDTLSGEPRDIEGLIETLSQARERGLINADAFEMLEGVLRVAEVEGGGIMVAGSQRAVG